MEFKGTKGNWEQITANWDLDQEVFVEDTEIIVAKVFGKPHEQIYNALLISKAPEMLQELQETLKDLLCIQGSIYDSSRIDARWEGAYDVIQKQIDRKKELIKQATEL